VVREAVEVPVKTGSAMCFLDVRVLHIERIFFNELTAWFPRRLPSRMVKCYSVNTL